MNEFIQQGLVEYRRQRASRTSFIKQTRRLAGLLDLGRKEKQFTALIMLTPLLEVGWIDGRIRQPEQDAIIEAAEIYGLLENESGYTEVMNRLSSRPHRSILEYWWLEIEKVGRSLSPGRCAAMAAYLLQQTHYISGLSREHTFGLWRGSRTGHEEQEALENMAKKLSHIQVVTEDHAPEPDNSTMDDLDAFLDVIPLVKVAWADGRISKRERKMIFDSAFELGLEPTAENVDRLAEWLDISPDEEFLNKGMHRLVEKFRSLHSDASAQWKYDLLSRCTLIAEASGGDRQSPSGGPRISEEERHAVMQIARVFRLASGSGDRQSTNQSQNTA